MTRPSYDKEKAAVQVMTKQGVQYMMAFSTVEKANKAAISFQHAMRHASEDAVIALTTQEPMVDDDGIWTEVVPGISVRVGEIASVVLHDLSDMRYRRLRDEDEDEDDSDEAWKDG